jgi:hypothetical protein
VFQEPPPDPVNRFLADPRRDQPSEANQEVQSLARVQRSQRNHRNYGGESFENVPRTMDAQRRVQVAYIPHE